VPGLALSRLGFGGDYNPEQWPREVWDEDVRLMREAGVDLVTLGVFSWAQVEPRPGEWDFGWFDEVMGKVGDAGLGVCLATMTASPPPWLSARHPEMLPRRADGVTLWPGGRQHYCPSSPVYREHAVALAEQVAQRYGGHPALRLWHVGNEYGCHVHACWCDVSAAAFRRWLRERHGTIEALNEAWSTAFWSQRYGDWEEVLPPRTAPTFPNPAQQVDFRRFSSDELLACYRAERDVLRRITPEVPITTNFHPELDALDLQSWAAELDVVSYDSYPDPNDPEAHVRAAFAYDVMRSLRGGQPWLLMEQTSAAVNWRPRNAPKRPGLMRRWSLQAVARGADAVLYFQWRQSRGGAERFHSAMLPHAGPETRVHGEIRELGAELAGLAGVPGSRSEAEVGLVVSWPSWWGLELDSHPNAELGLLDRVHDHYLPLWEANVLVDVVAPSASLDAYRLLVVPNLYLVSAQDAARLDAWVQGGGHLLVSFFSGVVDEADRLHPGGYAGALRGPLGVFVEELWPLAGGEALPLDLGDERGTATEWSEALVLEGAEAVAAFGSGPLAGRPAVTRHERGAGLVTYVATRPDRRTMARLLRDAVERAGVEPTLPGAPAGVEAVRRGEHLFLLNHGEAPAAVAGVELPPGGAAVVPAPR